MNNENQACPNCGKNSCDTTCNPNPQNQANEEGEILKKLIPSCHLSSADIVKRKSELEKEGMFRKVIEVNELPNGLEFIFDGIQTDPQLLLDYISFERTCCSSFSFALEFEPNMGNMHMRVFGNENVKEQMKNVLQELKIR